LEGLGVNGRIILRWIFKKWFGGSMDWIDVVQNRVKVLVNEVVNLRVP